MTMEEQNYTPLYDIHALLKVSDKWLDAAHFWHVFGMIDMYEAARQQDHATIAALRAEVEGLKKAGDALDHKFIDLVAFCAANIPEDKLQDLVDDWAGHDERKAWKEATT